MIRPPNGTAPLSYLVGTRVYRLIVLSQERKVSIRDSERWVCPTQKEPAAVSSTAANNKSTTREIMSDPLLTTLCTICHREPPKYRCPRCSVRTCSLPCTKKHKAWASCSGERDPAAFVPRQRLVTDAGVDHDYNFISSIERAKERFEKTVVDDKRLLGEAEVRGPKPGQEDRRFEKVWYGDQLVHEPAVASAAAARGGGGRGGRWGGGLQARFDQLVRQRLRRNDIRVLTMPKGLSRQKENKTAWNRRTNTINWQVEWLLFNIAGTGTKDDGPVRVCHKSLDEKPLYRALADALEWERSAAQKRKRAREEGDVGDDEDEHPQKRPKGPTRKQRALQQVEAMTPCQDWPSSTWPATEYSLQCTVTGRWSQVSSDPSVPRSGEEEAAELAKLRFFLLKPATPDDPLKGLIPLSSADNLVGALSGRTIIEFPTLYVVRPDAALPNGLALASPFRRSKDPDSEEEEEAHAPSSSNRVPARNNRRFERPREGSDSANANRAPLRNNRLSGRRGGGAGPDRPPQRHVEFAVGDDMDVEEGELNSAGEKVYNARRAMAMVAASITADAKEFAGDGDIDVGEVPEHQVAKPARGLVDYGSDSDAE